MIVFDLACDRAHVFEAWFGSSEEYESQRTRGLVTCPLCGSAGVAKAVMAPNVAPKGNRAATTLPVRSTAAPGVSEPAQRKAMFAALAGMQARMLETSEHVGPRFADEARAIYIGDAPERQIHGEATLAEARDLVEDGVPVAPLPFPIVPPDALH